MKIPDFLISKFSFASAIFCDISAIHPIGERQQLPLVFKFEAGLRSEEFLHQTGVSPRFEAARAVNPASRPASSARRIFATGPVVWSGGRVISSG